MSMVLQQGLILLSIVIFQRSFFDVLWPSFIAPVLIITVIIALVFVLGFTRALGWVLLLVFFYTLLGNDDQRGMFPIVGVVIAYGTSFLSRRLLIEQHVESSLALGIFGAVSVLVYWFLMRFSQNISITISVLLGNALAALIIFPIVFTLLRIWDERVRFSRMSEFRGLRT